MLGFTRHERLDVKKPGPVVSFKPRGAEMDEHEQNGKLLSVKSFFFKLPNLLFFLSSEVFNPKMKKVFHPLSDHGAHSVDTNYAYVILKSP